MKSAKQITVLITVCLSIAAIAHFANGQRLRAASSDFKEFTLVRTEVSESSSPSPMRRTVLVAHRADGSRMEGELSAKSPGYPRRRSVWLVPQKIRVEVDDNLNAKTTFYFKSAPAPRPPAPDPRCGFSRLVATVNPVFRGESEVLGFKTVGLQTEVRLGDQSFLRTDWKAPDLDCADVKMTSIRRDSMGNATGHFEVEAARIAVGAPDPKLFDVPQNYAEKSPSQMYETLVKDDSPKRPPPENMRRRLDREDDEYTKNHQAFAGN